MRNVEETKVKNSNFLHKTEILHPKSTQYLIYWKEVKRRIIEGYWFEGKWMPGPLYFYVNFCKILMNREGSKTKSVSTPLLRDAEWEKAFVYTEAKGFSGFELDSNITCNWFVYEIEQIKSNEDKISKLMELTTLQLISEKEIKEVKNGNVILKQFEHPRTYLRRIHSQNLGKPLYRNNAKNCIDIECFDPNTELLLPDLTSKKIKDIKVNDFILGEDGNPKKVLDWFEGDSEMYDITTQYGTHTVSKGHLVRVIKRYFINGKYTNKKRLPGNWETEKRDYKVEDLYKIKDNPSFKNEYYIYQIPSIEFSEKNLKIDPYLLGLWLSDGRSNTDQIVNTNNELKNYLINTFKGVLKSRKKYSENQLEAYEFKFNNRLELKQLNLLFNKHIPNEYLNSSISQRYRLLEGIIDGDGHLDRKCKNYVISCGRKLELAEQVVILCKSLGHRATIKNERNGSNWKVTVGGDIWKINPIITYKNIKLFKRRNTNTKSSFTIVKKGIGKFVGITVEDDLVVLKSFEVSHNCRRNGKSYFAANGMILHNFITDGCTDYDAYLDGLKTGNKFSSETLVGAIDAKYTKDLLSKTQLSLDNIEGNQTLGGVKYPSPLLKTFRGSFAPGKFIESAYEAKEGNNWVVKGSRSKIHNRTFSSNPLAGNGTGPNLTILEEVGFMDNLIDVLGAMKDATYSGINKFGVVFMTGTGGAMESGKSEAAREVFFNPEAYDCLAFDDTWENSGKIGYFVSYHYNLDGFRDTEGVVNYKLADKWIEDKRAKLALTKSSSAMLDETTNNPIKPSEAFQTSEGSRFPTLELKEHLNNLKSSLNKELESQNGELVYVQGDKDIKVKWVPDLSNKLKPCHFNMKPSDNTKGCVQIWEHPVEVNGEIPPFLYIAGCDPYDQDQAPNSVSLGSTFIYKCFIGGVEGEYETVVAEYTARPDTAKDYYENVKKLLLYYNAKVLYENERNGIKMHFEHSNCLYLLLRQPDALKSLQNSNVNRVYGIHMNSMIKNEVLGYTSDWLIQSKGDGKLNLHSIKSIVLLEELIHYNEVGNFDRVIAFALTILHRLQNTRIKIELEEKEKKLDPFLTRAFGGKFF